MPSPARAHLSRAATLLVTLLLLLAIPAPAIVATSSVGTGRGGTPSPVEPSDGARGNAKWTYLVYMAADNNLEDEAILNVNQMEAVGSSDDLAIVIQLDRSPLYDETNGNWTGTRRYYVTTDGDADTITSQLVQDMGEVDMGNPDRLRDFVVWGVTNYPADRFYLDVWGHGGGWRDGTCNDYTSGTAIDTDDLGVALAEAEALTNTTLDGVGFDQCLMAQLEVFYEIKARADVFVGAETLIPSEGYNYTRIMQALAADTGMDARGLASVIVTAFFDEYGHDNQRAHSAVDAEELDARLAPAVSWLGQLLRGRAESLHDEIKLARDKTQTYSTLDYIDLGNFTQRLLELLPENETDIRRAAVEVMENVTASMVEEGHGTGRNGSTGLSFYFPRYGSSWSYSNLGLSKEQSWDEFLQAFFDRKDRPNLAPRVSVGSPHPGSVVGLEFELTGSASDDDGQVGSVEWKFDRGPWRSSPAGLTWSATVPTDGVRAGLHRLSVRVRDDAGDYSREVQFQLNVESRGLRLEVGEGWVRTYPGGTVTTDLALSSYGEEGGTARLEVVESPAGWSVGLPFAVADLGPEDTQSGELTVEVAQASPKGTFQVLLRTWMEGAPLIQAFVRLEVNVTDRYADLVAVSISFDPPDPEDGDNVTIRVLASNVGLEAALDFGILLVHRPFSGENWTEVVLLNLTWERLEVGADIDLTVPWTASIGYHEFELVLDGEARVPDLDRSNNLLLLPFLLEGYAVRLDAPVQSVVTGPGVVETVNLTLTNMGNLVDILQLFVVNTTLGWRTTLSETSWYLYPKASANATLQVHVPATTTGGVVEEVTLRLASFNDGAKFQEVRISFTVPEVFGMRVSSDRPGGSVAPLGTVSFNITIENVGNGYENYTIDYLRQTEDLLVNAVNDTVEVAPGCSTRVEVFVSSLGTPVGGETLFHGFTVRSLDDPSQVATVTFSVLVERVFGLRGVVAIPSGGLHTLPGATMVVTLGVYSEANYPLPLAFHVLGDGALFEPSLLREDHIEAEGAQTYDLVLQVKRHVVMGDYLLALSVNEVGAPGNGTVANATVRVDRVDDQSLSVNRTDGLPLVADGVWTATLNLTNKGNHAESYNISVTGAPEWMTVSLPSHLVTLPAYGSIPLEVNVTIAGIGDDGFEGEVMLVIRAAPANQTGVPPAVVLDVPVEVPPDEGGVGPWLLYLALVSVLAAIVLVGVIAWLRRSRA